MIIAFNKLALMLTYMYKSFSWISSEGGDQRIFLGLKFLIPGFFWVGKFCKYFFVWLDLRGDLT